MSRRPADLAALRRVTEASHAAQLGRMAVLKRAEAAIVDQVRALDLPPRPVGDEIDPARRAGADILWQTWAEARRRALNLELARARAAIESARTDLARSFGRDQALRSLSERLKREAARAADRRATD